MLIFFTRRYNQKKTTVYYWSSYVYINENQMIRRITINQGMKSSPVGIEPLTPSL